MTLDPLIHRAELYKRALQHSRRSSLMSLAQETFKKNLKYMFPSKFRFKRFNLLDCYGNVHLVELNTHQQTTIIPEAICVTTAERVEDVLSQTQISGHYKIHNGLQLIIYQTNDHHCIGLYDRMITLFSSVTRKLKYNIINQLSRKWISLCAIMYGYPMMESNLFTLFNTCIVISLVCLTLYVAVTQFTIGKLRHCYVKS